MKYFLFPFPIFGRLSKIYLCEELNKRKRKHENK